MIKFKVTEEIQTPNVSNRYMGPGIHENVEMTRVEYAKTEKGSEYLAFYFMNEKQEQLSHTEWKIKMNKPLEEMEEGLVKFYTNITNEQVSRIDRIVTTFIPKETFQGVEADTFEDFANKTIAVLGDHYKGIKIRIKVVYDKRNYTSLPPYTNYRWIETMAISREKSEIEILGKDKMAKDIPAKLEGANDVSNIIEQKATSSSVNESLPF